MNTEWSVLSEEGFYMKIEVRVSETDLLGHINNKSYFDYIEESTNYFYSEARLPITEPYTFILAKVCCEFINQGFFGQTLRLESYPTKVGNKSMTLVTNIIDDKEEELIARGESVLVYFDVETQDSFQIPSNIRDNLAEYRREKYDKTI